MKTLLSFPANNGTTLKGNIMSKEISSVEIVAGQLSFTKAVTFSFRPQPLLDDDNQSTKLEGVNYIDHEVDRAGNIVMEEDGTTPKPLYSRKKLATKRLPISINITYPLLFAFGIQQDPTINANGDVVYTDKALQLLHDQIISVVDGEARAILDTGKTPTDEELDFAVIAAKPKAQRASSSKAVDKDSLVSAIESFAASMIALGKNEKGVEAQVKFFKARCRGAENMDVTRLDKIQENLALWYAGLSEDAQSDHVDAFEFLNDKMEKAKTSEFDLDAVL